MQVRLTEEIWKEGNMYVSYCPELDMAACGATVSQSKDNLVEVFGINLEEMQKQGTAQTYLHEAGLLESGDAVWGTNRELVAFDPIEVSL